MSFSVAKDVAVTPCEVAAWLAAALLLVLVLKLQLLAAFFAGLLVFELVHVLVPVFHLSRLAGKWAKLVAVALLSTLIVGVMTLAIFCRITSYNVCYTKLLRRVF